MTVDDTAIPVVLSIHFFTWALNWIVFAYLLRSSLTCLNKDAAAKSTQYNCCGFLSTIHFIAFWCFVLYQFSCINFLFTTNFLFPRASINCVAVTINAVASFTVSKFTQYAFFIYRLNYVFQDSFVPVEPGQVRKAVAFLFVYIFGMLILSTIMSSQIAETQPTVEGKYLVCVRDIQRPLLVVLTVAWYAIFDTSIMVWVVHGFVSRLLQMCDISAQNTAAVKMYKLAYRSLVLFAFSIMTTVVTAVFTVFLPGHLMWFFSPHTDLTMNSIAIALTFQFMDGVYAKLCGCMDKLVVKLLMYLFPNKIKVEFVADYSRAAKYIADSVTVTNPGKESTSGTEKVIQEQSTIQDII